MMVVDVLNCIKCRKQHCLISEIIKRHLVRKYICIYMFFTENKTTSYIQTAVWSQCVKTAKVKYSTV